MRKPFYILLLTCLVYSNLRAQTSLKINVVDCANNEPRVLSQIELISGGKSMIIDKQNLQSIFLIPNLNPGKYKIKYDTYCLNYKEEDIVVLSDKENSVTLCTQNPDSNAISKSILSNLAEKDSMTFIIASDGCFHSYSDTLRIKKSGSIIHALYGSRSKMLDKTDLAILLQFESQIKLAKDRDCTTVNAYTIIYKKKKKKYLDGSCDWDFGMRIIDHLFPQKGANPFELPEH